jgi:hypothetical protein
MARTGTFATTMKTPFRVAYAIFGENRCGERERDRRDCSPRRQDPGGNSTRVSAATTITSAQSHLLRKRLLGAWQIPDFRPDGILADSSRDLKRSSHDEDRIAEFMAEQTAARDGSPHFNAIRLDTFVADVSGRALTPDS